jgi:diacylglycerol kinase (ATP)
MDTTLFLNLKAGDEAHSEDSMREMLETSGLSVDVQPTKGHGLKKALKKLGDLVVIAGGDGTVGRIARSLPDRSRPCAVIPLGTANNLARALGSWPSPEDFAQGWRRAAHKHLNLASAHGDEGFGKHRFVESFGFGAFASAIEQADAEGLEGVEAGREVFRRTLAEAPVHHAHLKLDEQEIVVETLLIEVMNIPLFGPNLPLAPQCKPGNGLLDIVLLPPERREAMLDWLHAPTTDAPPVETLRCATAIVDWPGGPLRIDDEPQDFTDPCTIRFRVEVEPLTFLAPFESLSAPKKARQHD